MPTDLSPGLLGAKLSEARERLDLFTWFHFEPAGEMPLPDGKKSLFFRPSGDAFHQLVKLHLLTDAQDRITDAYLHLDRAFIDNPAQCVFAGDLAKSFLAYAGTQAADRAITELIQEIQARAMGGSSQPLITAQGLPEPPAEMSPAYRTYAGKSGHFGLINQERNIWIRLENRVEEGKRILEISLSPTPPLTWWARVIGRLSGRSPH